MAAPSTTAPPQLSRSRRVGILAICCTSLLIVGIDLTIVNVALPSIGHQFHASVSGLQWTIDAYTLVIAALLMLAGATADRVGRKRVFRLGLTMFTLGSALCSLAPNLPLLVVFRMIQAVGGSMLNPVAMSIITNTFTDRKERAQAIGIWGVAIGFSMALGPIVGGVLVNSIGWRSIFWINIPVGIGAILLTSVYVPESKAPRARRPDPPAQILVVVLLVALTYAIIQGPRAGWMSAEILGCFAVAAAALVALLIHESGRREPLIDLRFFRSAPFSGATAIAVFAFAALGGFLLLNTLYLQDARHLSALHAGLDTLPMAVTWLLAAPFSGQLVGRGGPRVPLVLAGACIAAAAVILSQMGATTPIGTLFVAYTLLGIGMGLVNPPISVAAVSGMPISQAGVAAAIASTSRQVGSTLGVAVFGALTTAAEVGGHLALPAATHDAWWVMLACGLAVLVLGAVTTTRWAHATASRTAAMVGA
ncbi:MAG TPA: MFS transporter [Acidimicrobiales bacterium]|nr:MFS transporter [Acidimicrobiales bacterium]